VQKQTKRYVFQADTIGVSGQIVQPFPSVIPAQAASALAADGGHGAARVGEFRHHEVLSFGSAHSEVAGTEAEDGSFETTAVAVVEKFNLLDVVTCDRMVARLVSTYPSEYEQRSDWPAENCITPLGSYFEGLRIGNIFFERLEVAPPYFCRPERGCWTPLTQSLDYEEERSLLAPLSLPAEDGSKVELPADGPGAGVMAFCIALGEPRPESRLGVPLCFEVPQFGTVHLGEFFCYPNSRQLIMLRVKLRGPHRGRVVGCQAMIRGKPYPP
jgi:hypothetical protein